MKADRVGITLAMVWTTLGCSSPVGNAATPIPASTALIAPIVVKPKTNYEFTMRVPSRPPDSKDIRLAVGLFDSYQLDRDLEPAMYLTLRNPDTGAITRFVLAKDTTLDGKPLPCVAKINISGVPFCDAISGEALPKGRFLAALYWVSQFGYGTDALVSMPRAVNIDANRSRKFIDSLPLAPLIAR